MADVLAVRDEYRTQNWAMVIQECSNSGLSNREFCRQRGSRRKLIITGFGNSAITMSPAATPTFVSVSTVWQRWSSGRGKSVPLLRPPDGPDQGTVLVRGRIYPALQTAVQRAISMATVGTELRLLDPQSFRWLMEGLRIEQKTAIRKGKPKDLF